MKVAVLVPVHNAAEFLPQCLDSVLSDPLRPSVFCLDDGSSDGSREILARYAAEHPRVKFSVQPNAGVSVTRNRLMDALPPEFDAFAFVDSDDYVRPGMYAALSEAMDRTGADVAECEWDGPETVVDDMSAYVLRSTAPGAWINVINKLYRRSAVGSVRFREGLAFEEDFLFNYEINAQISRKVLVPGHYYTYRDNPASATHALNHRRYFDSVTRRIRLCHELFLAAGRIPSDKVGPYRAELAKDAYRMVIRKNLKKNRNPSERRELFEAAGDFFAAIEREFGFAPLGLNPVQKLIYAACRRRRYALARALVALT